jgi:hypothetical protein
MKYLVIILLCLVLVTGAIFGNALSDPKDITDSSEIIGEDNIVLSHDNESFSDLNESDSVNISSLTNDKKAESSKKTLPPVSFTLTGSKSVSPGSQITYTIKFRNNLDHNIDVVIAEDYDTRAIFVKSNPNPDQRTNNIWTINGLHPSSKYETIKITLKVPKSTSKAEIEGTVSGAGYSSVHRMLSTEKSSYTISNQVTISYENTTKTLLINTRIKPVDGATIDFREHGPGEYRSNESLRLSSTKVAMNQELQANSSKCLVNISGRLQSYNGSWYVTRLCENGLTKTKLDEEYLSANTLDLESNAKIHSKETSMETKSNFTGIAEYDSKGKNRDVNGMYIGSFRTKTKQVESFKSNGKYPDNGWLECCSEEPNNQSIEDDETENDIGNETIEEYEIGNETINE